MVIFTYDEVDFKKIKYNTPEKKGLVYYSGISYNEQPFHIQTPKLKCLISGAECINRKSPSLDLENINNDFKFYDFLLSIDENNVLSTFKESEKWFDKEIPKDTIDEMYKRLLKPVKKGNRPTYSFKVPTLKGQVQCPLYDQHKICQTIEKCDKDIEVELIIHIRGLKFLKQNFYCDSYISQIKIYLPNEEKYSIINDYSFKDSNEKLNEINEDEEQDKSKEEVESEKVELEKVESKKVEKEVESEEVESKKVEKEVESEKEEVESEESVAEKIRKEYEKKFIFLQEQLNLMKKDFN